MGSHDANNRKLGLPVEGTELDWILMQADCPILFYDKNQVVGPSGISDDLLKKKINTGFKDGHLLYANDTNASAGWK